MNRTLLMIAAAAALVIALPLALFAASDNYNYCAGNQGQYAEPPKDDESAPYVHGPISDPTLVRLLVHCSGVYATQNADAITAIATVVMTVATFLLGWLALDQGRTARAQLRGYVFLKPGPTSAKAGSAPTMEVKIKNFGPTPISKMCVASDVLVLDKMMVEVVIDPPNDQDAPQNTLGPGENHKATLTGSKVLTEEDLTAITAGKKALFYAGVVQYTDAFGRERKTRFNWVWYGEMKTSGSRRITHCDKGNSWT